MTARLSPECQRNEAIDVLLYVDIHHVANARE